MCVIAVSELFSPPWQPVSSGIIRSIGQSQSSCATAPREMSRRVCKSCTNNKTQYHNRDFLTSRYAAEGTVYTLVLITKQQTKGKEKRNHFLAGNHNKNLHFTVVSFHRSALSMCKYMKWNRMCPLRRRQTLTTFNSYSTLCPECDFSDRKQSMLT